MEGGHYVTEVELLEGVKKWMAAIDERLKDLSIKVEEAEYLCECKETAEVLVERFKKNTCMTTQWVCVLSLQILMNGKKYALQLQDALDGIHNGNYVLVATRDMAALASDPVGSA